MTLSYNTTYYVRVIKSGTSVIARIYSDSGRTSQVGSDLSVTLNADRAYRYLFAMNSFNNAADDYFGVAVSSLNIGEQIVNFTIAGEGGTNNEDLIFDLETTADTVAISSGTGVTDITWTGGLTMGGSTTSTLVTRVSAGAPTESDANGSIVINSGDSPGIYYRYGGAWHYAANTAGFQIPNFETTDPISGEQIKEGDLVVGMIDKSFKNNALHGVWVKWDTAKNLLGTGETALSASGAVGIGTIQGVETGGFATSVKNTLVTFGIIFKDNVNEIANLITDKLTAKMAHVEKLEMVDNATGETWCTWIENGEWQKEKRDCIVAVAETVSQPISALNPVSETILAPVSETVSASEVAPQLSIEPVPAPETQPEITSQPESVAEQTEEEIKQTAEEEEKNKTKEEVKQEVKKELKDELKKEVKQELSGEMKKEVEKEAKKAAKETESAAEVGDLKKELKEIKEQVEDVVQAQEELQSEVIEVVSGSEVQSVEEVLPAGLLQKMWNAIKKMIPEIKKDVSAGLLPKAFNSVKKLTPAASSKIKTLTPTIKDAASSTTSSILENTESILQSTGEILQGAGEFLKTIGSYLNPVEPAMKLGGYAKEIWEKIDN